MNKCKFRANRDKSVKLGTYVHNTPRMKKIKGDTPVRSRDS